jgi:hypothetical protein
MKQFSTMTAVRERILDRKECVPKANRMNIGSTGLFRNLMPDGT